MGGLGADLNGAAEDRKSQLYGEECMHGELGFGRKGGGMRAFEKGNFWRGGKGQ